MAYDKAGLGAAIKRAREEKGLTQQQLADRLKVHKMTLVKYESGTIDVSASRLRMIEDELALGRGALTQEPDPVTVAGYLEGGEAEFVASRALRRGKSERVLAIADGYLARLRRIGTPAKELEQVERLLLDPRYGKRHSTQLREMTEDEEIEDMEGTWTIVSALLAARGRRP